MKIADHNSESQLRNTEKYFTVPADMLIDVLCVLVNNSILYQIKTVDLNDSSILLYLSSKDQPVHYVKAIENIETLLDEYTDYSKLL